MNLENEINRDNLKSLTSKPIKIFFMRICGTGMGACAVLMKSMGHQVEGADSNFFPPMSDSLNDAGVKCHKLDNIDEKFLKDYDLLVVGNSIARGSAHALLVENAGVAFTSFPTLLGETLLAEREVIGAIGTHGKTTTSYFIAQMLENLGEDPGYFIGGVIEGRESAKLGKSKYFIIESDEYDSAYFQKYSKFHQYHLNHMVMTSLEFDHADIFSDFEDIKDEFRKLYRHFDGVMTYDSSYPAIGELAVQCSMPRTIAYGEPSSVGPEIKTESEKGTTFGLSLNGEEVLFTTNLVGRHNIKNLSGSLLLLNELGFQKGDLLKSVINLKMVKRRQEERGSFQGALFVDDFAHHPKAITETIKAIKAKYPKRSVHVVYEPVSATARSNAFQHDYIESFVNADHVVIADPEVKTTAKSFEQLDTNQLVNDLSSNGTKAMKISQLDELRTYIQDNANQDSLFLVLSNRTCLGLWSSDFVEKII